MNTPGAALLRRLRAYLHGRRRGYPDAALPPDAVFTTEAVMLRVLCHELRAPVASLGSLTRVLSDPAAPVPPPVRAEIADLAHRQAVHLDALLAEARTAVGAVYDRAAGPSVVPLAEALSGARTVVAPQRLTVSVGRAAARRAVPAPMVQQVLTNLLDNAARHSPPGSRIRLSARTQGGTLLLSVANHSARPDEVAAVLADASAPTGLSGLGLSIVARLVADADGTVRARRRGRAVVVDVVLPALPE